ncbi:MAG: glycine oxidase ThiO [Nitrospinae bacterium]|nr:glycine oxidase ThiO [Nitrospinota bacterium]
MGNKAGRAGIIGAGILGRLTAYFLIELGWEVALFEEGPETPANSSFSPSYTAAGMLAPYCELEYAEPIVVKLGVASFPIWESVVKTVGGDVFYQREGSLVVAHQNDKNEFLRLKRAVEHFTSEPVMKQLKRDEIRECEPDVDPKISDGLFFPHEGQIDTGAIMRALSVHLKKNGATINFDTKAENPTPKKITTAKGSFDFDCVVDCRGMGAKADLKNLRGVRGEVFRVNAPDVSFRRPVRLIHPRYPIYVVPRPNHDYIIGATSIESEDLSTVSVRGALELLSALYSLSSGFSEARIMETATQLRPAFLDNAPKIIYKGGLCRANGLFRHGFLASPMLAKLTAGMVAGGKIEAGFESIYEAV